MDLHVIIRYEIERDLINDRLKVSDLPEVWEDGVYVVPITALKN